MATNNNRNRQTNSNNNNSNRSRSTPPAAASNKPEILCGGYDANFEPALDKKYMCPVCLAGLQKPVQTKCGHRFCKACMTQLAGTRSFAKCPVDKTWLDIKNDVFGDIAVEREVLSLKVKCKNVNNGCDWIGELRHLTLHSEKCQFTTLICPYGCEETYLRQENDDHLRDCPLRLIDCPDCEEKIAHKDKTAHRLLLCPRFPINCCMCGRSGVPREEMPKHTDVQEGDCPNTIVPCTFANVGCKAKVRRSDIVSHNKESTFHHLESLVSEVISQKTCLQQQEEALKESQDNYTSLRSEHDELTRQLADKNDQLMQQSDKINQLENTSYNGCLHWKVKIPQRSSSNSQNGSNQVIMSPPFYTGCPGHKLRACLELKGHKSGNIYHSSLSIVLCQGKYDNDLHFPFSSTCLVTLYDQSTRGCNNFVTSFACNNMPRTETDGNENQKRGRLSFMKTDTLTKGRFCVGGYLYMQIDMSPITSLTNFQTTDNPQN
ncbi:TNF receptor-associated factor 6-like isoform X2 [Amphiura filiformis]